MNMFSYLCLYAKSICVSFGERRINTNLFNSAFVKWCSQYHKYFPYKCFDNPPPVFTSKSMDGKYTFPGSIDGSQGVDYNLINQDKFINKTEWYIDKLNWVNYENVYQDGTSRKEYIQFITQLFRCVQPKMTDVDKFFMTSMFIMNWIKYCGIMTGPSYNNRGPCADYANLQSLALQLLGVPAIPLQCGMQAAPHAIVWVYLDIGFGKKWYLSDLTFGDSGFEPYNGILASSPWINNKSWILTDIAPSQFVSIDEVTQNGTPAYQHDISNVLYGAPWPDIANSYNNTGIPMIGEVSYGNQDNYVGRRNAGIGLTSNFNYFTSTIGTLEKSRIFYINGKGYYFEKDSNSSHGIRLCELK